MPTELSLPLRFWNIIYDDSIIVISLGEQKLQIMNLYSGETFLVFTIDYDVRDKWTSLIICLYNKTVVHKYSIVDVSVRRLLTGNSFLFNFLIYLNLYIRVSFTNHLLWKSLTSPPIVLKYARWIRNVMISLSIPNKNMWLWFYGNAPVLVISILRWYTDSYPKWDQTLTGVLVSLFRPLVHAINHNMFAGLFATW